MKITMLGTGHAMVDNCFNTCFIMENDGQCLLVDTGGGYQILPQLKKAGYDVADIHDVFITHRHTDHLTGILWIIRVFLSCCRRHDDAHMNIYGHAEVAEIVRSIASMVFAGSIEPYLDRSLCIIPIHDRQEMTIIGNRVTFFDIKATKVLQYGFVMGDREGKKIICCGDEPLCEENFPLAENCTLLMHEAFCLSNDEDAVDPHRIGHSTVSDACRTADKVHAEAILIYHTEDRHMQTRKKLYTAEGQQAFTGTIYVPDDLETIII